MAGWTSTGISAEDHVTHRTATVVHDHAEDSRQLDWRNTSSVLLG
jgi:hypothetical protein